MAALSLYRAFLWRVRREGTLSLIGTPLAALLVLLLVLVALPKVAPGLINDPQSVATLARRLGVSGHASNVALMVSLAPGIVGLMIAAATVRVARNVVGSEVGRELTELLIAAGCRQEDIAVADLSFVTTIAMAMSLLAQGLAVALLYVSGLAYGAHLSLTGTFWLLILGAPFVASLAAALCSTTAALARPELVQLSQRSLANSINAADSLGMAPAVVLLILVSVAPAQDLETVVLASMAATCALIVTCVMVTLRLACRPQLR